MVTSGVADSYVAGPFPMECLSEFRSPSKASLIKKQRIMLKSTILNGS